MTVDIQWQLLLKRLVFSLAAVLILSQPAKAQQQTISFDETDPTDIPILTGVACGVETGFRFTSAHLHLVGGSIVNTFASNGSTYVGYESGRGFPITLERVGAGTFSLSAFDASEFYAPGTDDRPDAERIIVTGLRQNGTLVTHTVFLDGLRDGPGGVSDFEHFELPATFANLTSVTFRGVRGSDLDGGIGIDNLVYQLSAPEALGACVAIPAASPLPVVSISTPQAGNVQGTVLIEAIATDNTGITGVEFALDGTPMGPAVVAPPYVISWDTTQVADGPHTLSVEATDTDGNQTSASVVVTVRNSASPNENPHYLDFDGVNDYLEIADAPQLSFGNSVADTPMTIEAWLRPDAMVRHQLLNKWESGRAEYKLHISSGVIRLDMIDGSANATVSVWTGNLTPLIGTWHHVAVTYDGRGGATAANGVTFYIDGVPVSVTRVNHPNYTAMENLSAPLVIGREGPNWKQFDGALDELRLWNVVRSPAQLQGASTTELSGTETGLVAYWKLNEGSGVLTSDATAAGLIATLNNGPGWFSGGPMGSSEPDVTAPTIASVAVGNITMSGATVTFTTNETATGSVVVTPPGGCPCPETTGAAATNHVIALTGLAPDTPYSFVVHASDAADNASASGLMTFRTLPVPPDTLPPTVSISNAGTVSGTVTLSATAVDNIAVAQVQFKVDGVDIGAPDTAPPYSASWNTTLVADGLHTITAEARDAANNVAAATVVLNVANNVVTSPHYLDFDGVDDYLQVANAPQLNFGNGTADTPLTIEAWIRPDAMTRNQLINKWESGRGEYRLHLSSNVLRFDIFDNSANATVSTWTGNLAALIGDWHHVAVTYDGRGGATAANGITIYIDGNAVAVTRVNHAAYVAMENLTAPLVIGREGPNWKQFDGALDELRMWNVARSQAELQSASTIELSGAEPGLVAYWKFDEGMGSSAADAAASGLSATLFNGTAWHAGGPMGPSEPDVTPPTIGAIALSNVTMSSVTVAFTTNEPTTAAVIVTPPAGCPCPEVASAATGTNHVVVLTGLLADSPYTVAVRATDASSNSTVSGPASFQTLPVPPDTTAPVVTMVTAPTVAGTVTIGATAVDNTAVVQVQFKIDGVNFGAPDTVAPYAVAVDTTLLADGLHTVSAEAIDAANNIGSASTIVNVANNVVTTPHYLDFDGVDDYLQVNDAPQLSFGSGAADTPLTFEAWIRPDAMVRHQLLNKWESGRAEYKLHISSGVIRLDLIDNSANATVSVWTGNLTALIGTWHHVAVTYDGRGGATAANGVTFYIDGVAVPVTRVNHAGYVAMENLAAPLLIGREGPNWKQFDGGLDELRLWNVARSAAELLAASTSELSGAEAGLVGYWKFNEGAGASAGDSSASGLTATVVNGAVWTPRP